MYSQTFEDLDEILARFVQPMAANAKDLLLHKSYCRANGGNVDELKKLLREEKAKNPKRIPYFFSASKQLPGKFLLGYQPGSKPRVEYVTVTPDGFRYRNQVRDSVNDLIKWFKEHYQEPVPRPVQGGSSSSTGAAGGGVSMGGAQIPSHISRNLDYGQLQAAVNTANQHHGSISGGTPYTPTHLAYGGTPTPQYGEPQQRFSSYGGGGGGGQQQQRGAAAYQQQRSRVPGQQFMGGGGQFGREGGGGGGGGASSWRTGGWGSHPSSHTPAQTPGRTPAYTPTQTPHSLYGNTPIGGRGGMTPRGRLDGPGTPLRDE